MTVLRFLDLDLTLHEAALIDTGSDRVAPVTADVIPGATVRGLLNRACGDDERLRELLVRSEKVQAAPALPLVRAGIQWRAAVPAPLVLATTGATRALVDARDAQPGSAVDPVRGLIATDGTTWHPVLVRTRTEQRLGRDRARPGGDAAGPFNQTVLAAGQRFRARLRIIADDDDEARAIAADIAAALHDPDGRRGLAVGAGADNSYGGALSTAVDGGGDAPEPSAVPDPSARPRDTSAGARVDVVLRSPALVRDAFTGEPDPDALGPALQTILDDVLGAGAATADTVTATRHLLGGFHGRYHGPRPEHWAASAGSTITVTGHRDLTRADWERVTAHRIGDRAADGCGVLGVHPAFHGTLGEAVEHRWPHDSDTVRLPDGRAAARVGPDAVVDYLAAPDRTTPPDPDLWQLAQLQDRLLWAAVVETVGEHATATVRAAPRPLPARHLLGALREAAASTVAPGPLPLTPLPPDVDPGWSSTDDAAAALARLDTAVDAIAGERRTSADRAKDQTPAQKALTYAPAGTRPLQQVLVDHDADLPEDVRWELERAVLWPDDPEPMIGAWTRRHRLPLRLLVVQTLLDRLVGAAGSEEDR